MGSYRLSILPSRGFCISFSCSLEHGFSACYSATANCDRRISGMVTLSPAFLALALFAAASADCMAPSTKPGKDTCCQALFGQGSYCQTSSGVCHGHPDVRCSGPRDGLTVSTSTGPVQGFLNGTTRVFRGIPYAAAPVNDLRLRPPQPAAAWKEVRDAKEFGKTCIQPYSNRSGHVEGMWVSIVGLVNASEDCLFINVYAPSAAGFSHRGGSSNSSNSSKGGSSNSSNSSNPKLLPVAVYMHAGEFQYGSSNDWENNGPFADDVVLVTFNYRLGGASSAL